VHLDDRSLPAYLKARGVPGLVGELSVEPAGEGNINFVRRVRGMGGGSVVVKHARPTLERFPEYSVTQERLCFERRYAEVVEELAPEVALLLPRVIDFDEELPAIVMEDLGDAPHLERLLLDDAALAEPLFELGHFLGRVHTASAPCARELVPRFANDELRSLHGEHIFTLPFEPNEFPIPDAVRQEACSLLASGTALKRIRALRRSYYESAEVLVHGDVQGTNVLVRGPGLRPGRGARPRRGARRAPARERGPGRGGAGAARRVRGRLPRPTGDGDDRRALGRVRRSGGASAHSGRRAAPFPARRGRCADRTEARRHDFTVAAWAPGPAHAGAKNP
jgi:5-methylthioribose kinase